MAFGIWIQQAAYDFLLLTNMLREKDWYNQTQKSFDKHRPIKFRKNHRINSLDDIIYWAIIKKEPTYFVVLETKKTLRLQEQCSAGRRRSTEDIYLLCKSYGINTTLEAIDTELDKLATRDYTIPYTPFVSQVLNRSHCDVVKRMVHYPSYDDGWNKVTKTKFKEILSNVRNRKNVSSG